MNRSQFRMLVPAFAGLIGVVYALAAYQYHLFPFEPVREPSTSASLSQDEVERLRALGYLSGYDEVRNEPTGVVHRAPEGVQPGQIFMCLRTRPRRF